jgi:uncharacterized SAM-binding protein YcdF (DUF218 family)
MRTARFVALLFLAEIAVVLTFVGINVASVFIVGYHHDTRNADVIVVMGAAQYDGTPSPQLAARLDHALELWKSGRAPLIAVTGGKRRGDRFTEAATSSRYLRDRGVPADVIISEDIGHSTWESLSHLAPILRSRAIASAIVVTDSYHLQRSVLSLRQLDFVVVGDATTTSPIDGAVAVGRGIREGIGIALGRIIGFDRLWKITG